MLDGKLSLNPGLNPGLSTEWQYQVHPPGIEPGSWQVNAMCFHYTTSVKETVAGTIISSISFSMARVERSGLQLRSRIGIGQMHDHRHT